MTDQPDAKTFRDAMRAFVGNCSVLTVGDGEDANGLVITSGISLSADPALILACVNRSSSSWPLFSPGAPLAGPRSAPPIKALPSVFRALAA